MWVALTRCRNLSDLTVFIHSDEEVKRFLESKIKQYYSFKVENYKIQDINANQTWVDAEYIDTKFIMDQVKLYNMKCSYCLKDIQVFINEEGNVFSDLTIDRKDNKIAHIRLNCKLCSLTCNISKKKITLIYNMVKKTSGCRTDLCDLVQATCQSQKDAKKLLGDRYTADPQLSSMNTKVFVDKKTNKPVVLHRGTTTLKDVLDDGLLSVGLGKYGFRYKNAQRVTKKAEEKYKQPAGVVGHSYGGYINI